MGSFLCMFVLLDVWPEWMLTLLGRRWHCRRVLPCKLGCTFNIRTLKSWPRQAIRMVSVIMSSRGIMM